MLLSSISEAGVLEIDPSLPVAASALRTHSFSGESKISDL